MKTLIQSYEQRGTVVSLFQEANTGLYEVVCQQGNIQYEILVVTSSLEAAQERLARRAETIRIGFGRAA